jgi:hypothetical protein
MLEEDTGREGQARQGRDCHLAESRRERHLYTASSPTIRCQDEKGDVKDGSSFGHELLDLAEAAREAALKIRDLSSSKVEGQSR